MALNKKVITLAKAIRQVESGHNFEARGASGERGAYQFMPNTWRTWARDFLGDANAEMTPENQNKVAYYKIESLKRQGYLPKQVASIWNSGSPRWEGKVGVNKAGVRFDVPAYVNKVIGEYKRLQTAPTEREIAGRAEVEREYQERMTGTEASRIQSAAKEKEKEEEIGFWQNVVQEMAEPFLKTGVTMARFGEASYQLGRAMLARIMEDEEEFGKRAKLAAEVVERGPVEFGYLGEVGPIDPEQTTWELTKESIGTGMEIGAWVMPGAPKGLSTGRKVIIWGSRGFNFGAGDALGEGKSVKEAMYQGAGTAVVSIGLGATTNKLVNSASKKVDYAKVRVEAASWTKLRVEAAKLARHAAWPKAAETVSLRNKESSFIRKELTEKGAGLLSSGKIRDIGLLGLIIKPKIGGLVVLAHYAYKALATPTGGKIIGSVTSNGLKALSKMEPATRSRIAESFMIQLYNQLVEAIIDNLRDNQESEQTPL